MKSLFLIGPPGSGKTAVALGLALKFRKEGYRAGYFKPVGYSRGPAGRQDEDGLLMRTILDMGEDQETVVPLMASNFYLTSDQDPHLCREKVIGAYETLAERYDPVIVDGNNFPWAMASYGLDTISVARDVGGQVVCTIKMQHDFTFDEALFFLLHAAARGAGVGGCIFNNIPRPLMAKSKELYARLMQNFGFNYLGTIPSRREIHAPTVAEFHEVLGGEILTGQEHMDRLVEDVLIGAMTIESALDTLRRALNKAVIVGGDRADYALAALETSTSVLILTGGLYPNLTVITRAKEKGVPVILVHYDTYTTIEKIEEVTRRIKPGDERAVAMALENIEQYCDWPLILKTVRAG
ncbi:MAG: DRTGG domain-containing protein [Thermoanaerobacterales bacterium]|nr:DRTGG domain-containing protein [Thermoanaerobacterales bacterium]